jgi:MazG family protein
MEDSRLDSGRFLLDELLQIVDTLRGKNGCPWDQKQTPETVIVYLIEEAYELAEAIQRENPDQIREELGDILFHILFITKIYRERGGFDLRNVVETITAKMIRRHPHVFDQKRMISSEEVIRNWHKIKIDEKKAPRKGSMLDSVPVNLPALLRAYRLTDRAAQSGIDWMDISGFLSEVQENLRALNSAVESENQSLLALAFGELFLSTVNAARVARVHPETALAVAVRRFEDRFKKLEACISETNREFQDVTSEEKARIWAEIDKPLDHEAG